MNEGSVSAARRETPIVNRQGLHARPAAMIVRCANTFRSQVTLSINGLEANGKSIMDVIMLASPCGSVVAIQAVGQDAQAAVDAIAAVIESGFGEELA